MAASVTLSRVSTLFNDVDGDGQFDPGDTITVRIRVANPDDAGNEAATGISVTDTLSGITLLPGSVQVSPVAFDDFYGLTGNTPISFAANQGLLANDKDADASTPNSNAGLRVTSVVLTEADGSATDGNVAWSADGSFTFTPKTGFTGTTSFKYYVTDAQGLGNVTEGVVTLSVSGKVWYVDNNYAGGDSDGSWLRPFTSLASLNDDGTAGGIGGADGVAGDDDVDGASDTIFLYHNAGAYTGGIRLETGQLLYGDNQALSVNGHTIGGLDRTGGADVTTASVLEHAGVGITLATGNTIRGLDIVGTHADAVGIQDGGGTVGTLAIGHGSFATATNPNVNITGLGKAVDIDQGGDLLVYIGTLSSANSSSEGVHLAGTATYFEGSIAGRFIVGNGSITGSQGTGFLLGNSSLNNAGTVEMRYGGTISNSVGGAEVVVGGRGGSTVEFSNTITHVATNGHSAIVVQGGSGSINFTGAANLDVGGSGHGLEIYGGNTYFTGALNIRTVDGDGIRISGHYGGSVEALNANNAIRTTGTGSGINDFNHQGGGVYLSARTIDTVNGNGISLNPVGGGFELRGASAITATGTGKGVSIVSGGGGSTFTGPLTIQTNSGTGFSMDGVSFGGVTLTGSNSVTTNTGQILRLVNGQVGGSAAGASFSLLKSTGVVAGDAIYLNNVDAGGPNPLTVTTVSIAGATGDGINISNNSNIRMNYGSVTIDNVGGDGIEISGSTGTITFTTVDIDGVGGRGVSIANSTVISGHSNSVIINGGSIGATDDPAGDAVAITNGVGPITIAATLTKTSPGNLVTIDNHETGAITISGNLASTGGGISVRNVDSGTITFSGASKVLNTGAEAAVTLASNSGVTVNFTGGGLDIDTTTGAGFSASGGTVTVQGDGNSITSTNGTALSVVGANIGSAGLNFRSISAGNDDAGADPVNGILLSNTGSSGGLNVTGDGGGLANGSGGTIRNTSGSGISLANTQNVRLASMNVTGSLDDGIRGSNVDGLVLDRLVVTGNGDAAGDSGIDLVDLAGSTPGGTRPTRIAGSTVGGNFDGQIAVANAGGTLADLVVSGNAIAADGVGAGLSLTVNGSAAATADIAGNAFTGAGPFIALVRDGSASLAIVQAAAGPAADSAELDDANGFNDPSQILASPGIAYGAAPPSPLLAASAPEAQEAGGAQQTGSQGGEWSEPAGDDPMPATASNGDAEASEPAPAPADPAPAEPAAPDAPPAAAEVVLNQDTLDLLTDAAIQRWADAGASPGQVEAMRAVHVSLSDMMGLYVGSSSPGTILIDGDGAGHGWFVDPTPAEDGEYEGGGTRLTADAGGPAEGRIDLLTVLMHELGHQIGIGDDYDPGHADALMYGYVAAGERRLPDGDDARGALPGSIGATAFALAPVSAGTLPDAKAVDIFFRATIDAQTNRLISNPTNSATVTSTTTPTASFAQASATETLALDSLTLGDRIFNDMNRNGLFDSFESGIAGVALELYADSNDNGVLDGGEGMAIATTTSGAGGVYSFAGLAPGDYVVGILSANFQSDGALFGYYGLEGGNDPDIDADDNDDNGVPGSGGMILSAPIDLAYNQEPGGDTNDTLDFGFFNYNLITGTNGNDNLVGTEGFDYINPLLGHDNVDGRGSTDFLTVDYSSAQVDPYAGAAPANAPSIISSAGGSFTGTISTVDGSSTATFSNIEQLNIHLDFWHDRIILDGAALLQGATISLNGEGGTDTLEADLSALPNVNFQFSPTLSTASFGNIYSFEVFVLNLTAGADTVTTGNGADRLNGNGGDDVLNSGGGNDTLAGGTGTNILNAGDGDDWITSTGIDTVDGGSGSGFNYDRWIGDYGSSTANLVFTRNGAAGTGSLSNGTTLTGIEEIFSLTTGSGDDLFTFTDAEGEGFLIAAGAGVDTLDLTGSSYSGSVSADGLGAFSGNLGAGRFSGIEHLYFTGNGAAESIAVAAAPLLAGATLYLDAAGGSDTLSLDLSGFGDVGFMVGADGTVTTDVPATLLNFETYQISAGSGDDLIRLGAGNDRINGNGGNDQLDGGAGADVMVGGLGDDIYFVDVAGDRVTELAGEGIDEIRTALASYTLPDNVEILTVTTNAAHDFRGNGGNNVVTGGAGNDTFRMQDGGNDSVIGGGGNDFFLFGATLNSSDAVDGGAGIDQVAIQGNYNITFGSGLVNIESLIPLPGNDVRFGDSGANFYDYGLRTVDANVGAGQRLTVDANRLRAGEDFTFDGSAETDGELFLIGGGGVDTLTGGAKNDTFLFGENNQFGASDTVNGGFGGTNDQLGLRGDYTITFGANQLIGIESIALVSSQDTRFGGRGLLFNYNLTMNDGNVAAGQLMTVDGAPLRSNETLTFNGSLESDGSYRVAGGAGNDTITGGQQGDIIIGRAGGDMLRGGGGNDLFRIDATGESNAAGRDQILDFASGDRIDLSRMDAIAGTPANEAFTFIGNAAFGNHAGELRFENQSGNIWLIQGDTDGNGVADFEVSVTIDDLHPITAADFFL